MCGISGIACPTAGPLVLGAKPLLYGTVPAVGHVALPTKLTATREGGIAVAIDVGVGVGVEIAFDWVDAGVGPHAFNASKVSATSATGAERILPGQQTPDSGA